ncbi:MAG: class I SAM-dependent methyltransferase [Planctomycetes bacterium]|nr:class I SAM-dependent methyltransferase [Planctomycetota bacterium]
MITGAGLGCRKFIWLGCLFPMTQGEMVVTTEQLEIDQSNARFWNELCGSGFARSLGLTDHSFESLRRFDEGFFGLYPYLLPIVQPDRMVGKDVLEIGLGYGTLGQKIAEAGARYKGLDIAPNAVEMLNHRLRLMNLPGSAVCGSALEMTFPDESFDFVVSIGCLHHTGNIQRCFDEVFRVLRGGGVAVLMAYNKFSWRQWTGWPLQTTAELLRDWRVLNRPDRISTERRKAYDANAAGEAAPETVLLSRRDLRRMLAKFESVSIQAQNMDPFRLCGRVLVNRAKLLGNFGRVLGLDLYLTAQKKATNYTTHESN